MRLLGLHAICVTVILLGSHRTFGQRLLSNQELVSKLSLSAKKFPEDILFIHTDKNIYTNNEDIWFSAYLVKSESVNRALHSILSANLVSEDTKKIYLQKKFAIENGIASGSVALPDSIPPGNYQLVAYTNLVDKTGMPLASFNQPVTIKSITETEFDFQATLLDSVANEGPVRVKVYVEFQNPIKNDKYKPLIEYSLGSDEPKSVKVKEDNTAVILIPATRLPAESPSLRIAVRYKDQVKYAAMKLPGHTSPIARIGIFPEGGHMVEGLTSKVGLEIKKSDNLPIATTCVVLENGTPVDTIETNSYGIGTFVVTPTASKRYQIRIARLGYAGNDTLLSLPTVLKYGAVLSLLKATVDDTLRFRVHSNTVEDLRVIIHDYRQGYASFDIAKNRQSTTQSVVLLAVPKGLCAITILNSKGQPLAERLFFAHFDRRTIVKTRPDKAKYSKREKVSLRLSLMGPDGLPTEGIISIACVQDNRIDLEKNVDIESFTYLQAPLGTLPANPMGRRFDDRGYVENILLVKAWRKYTWQEILDVDNVEPDKKYRTLAPTGKVKYVGKNLKKPVEVNLMKELDDFNLINTYANGDFDIPISALTTPEDKMIRATVNEKQKEGYSIELLDPFADVSANLAKNITSVSEEKLVRTADSNEFNLSGLDHTNLLNEVIIRSAGSDATLYGKRKGPNACGDYVIGDFIYYPPANGIKSKFYDISKARSQGHPPQKGVMYRDGMKGLFDSGTVEYLGTLAGSHTFKAISLTYNGCIVEKDKSIFPLEGIYFARQFYGFDEKLSDVISPQLLSTLYWKPQVRIEKTNETAISFFTGDISGKFRLTVQGVGEQDLIFGEYLFEVK